MFQKEHKQTSISRNAIFTTGSMRASKLLPSLILTFFILFADINFEIGKEIKSMALNLFKPINEVFLNIESFSDQISLFFTSQNKLIKDINDKNQEIDILNFKIMKQNQLKQENRELLLLLGFSENINISKFLIGKVLNKTYFPQESLNILVDTNNFSKEMVAINTDGLVGQVEAVFPNTVKVIPIYAKGNNIPAIIDRTETNIILEGDGKENKFFIKNLKNNSNIQIGDKIFTSGLGEKFPKGYLIGSVKEINASEELSNLDVVVYSSNNFDKGTKILFVSP
ncbi:rod shape-determining protein MreC [SAR86 cluster bacterium]|nr:rod shape-determining protein MreC [SAR86 cluster bacterium]